jgi:hypothetical protein
MANRPIAVALTCCCPTSDAKPRQHETKQTDELNKDIDQHAGDGQIDDDAESGKQSCPDDIAADHRHGKE